MGKKEAIVPKMQAGSYRCFLKTVFKRPVIMCFVLTPSGGSG